MDGISSKEELLESGRWSDDEQQKFVYGVMKYGKDWKKVQQLVTTRTGSQVRSHAQKFFLKINKIHKQHKKLKRKDKQYVISEIETQFIKQFRKDFLTESTPSQITSLIFTDEVGEKNIRRKHIKNNNNILKERNQGSRKSSFRESDQQLSQKQPDHDLKQQTSQKGDFHGIKQSNSHPRAIVEDSNQDQSYLMFVLRSHLDHFSTNNDFTDFIDFGSSLVPNSTQDSPDRKRSFHLFNEEGNEQKLQQTLLNIRNNMSNN